jgi:hypothetical protein
VPRTVKNLTKFLRSRDNTANWVRMPDMTDFTHHSCVICGAPATHYTAQEDLQLDGATGEVVNDAKAKPAGRYYCNEHVPRLQVEPLEDRLD